MPSREDAVSGVIGGVLLIALVLIGAAIVGTYVASQPLPEKVPKVQFNVKGTEDLTILYLEHAGGESLRYGTFDVLVDGAVHPSRCWSIIPDSDIWSLGDRIRIECLTANPHSVGLVYRE